ncbi:MAG: Aminodeoxychorismate lyase [Parcubacteria group bacterium GW2011_GWC1_41_7]|nr:MAG: Aminodeoxychorismate lyase [Parcubacteria group bacterium GW2011_GWC1_41_7]
MAQEEFLKKLLKLYPYVVTIFFVLIIGIYSIYQTMVPVFLPSPGKELYIAPKTSLREISNTLEREGIVRSAFFFRLYLGATDRALTIKPGKYVFEGSLDFQKLSNTLTKGGEGISVTIPEGLTLIEIQDILKSNGLKVNFSTLRLADFPESELLKYFSSSTPLEGFLAPDTYEFFPEEKNTEIAQKFLKNFNKKFLPEILKHADENLYQKLILASIIEKEVRQLEDGKIVAGILEKRITSGKRLEVDSTAAYERCIAYPCSWAVSSSQLKTATPYNTYRISGYPPTPISNPSVWALTASLEPQPSQFWYYLTNKNGKTIFAKTFVEHTRNIRKYLK